MTDDKLTMNEFHLKIAKQTNGGIWVVLDKKNATEDELSNALNLAHTSLYHWGIVGTPVNIVRGEYMIARVFSDMKKGEAALFYANRMLELTKEAEKTDENFADFDMPFVYEAMAKAHAAAGNKDECKKYHQMAQELTDKLAGEQDRKICQGEIDKISC
ncbi:MAG: hypothetical protein RTU30_15225 [Candidatus Thorarchaeota archaeon]